MVQRYLTKIQIANERLYWLGKSSTKEATFTAPFTGLLPTIAAATGVYKVGFATTQAAYDAAVHPLFETLDWLDERVAHRRYLSGDTITEADWRLFTTLLRFDAVYVGHFKCNIFRLVDYRALWGYARDLYAQPGVRETVDFTHIKRHYYMSHPTINPHRVVPAGPELDWDAPPLRGRGVTLA